MSKTKKNYYALRKAYAVQEAKDWQSSFADNNYSYGELAYYQDYFERLAKRYGLIREFREEGII